MAFVARVLFLSALVYTAKAGILHGGHDSYAPTSISAPSATYGAPVSNYGPPAPALEYNPPAPAIEYSPPAPSPTIDTTHIHSPAEADLTGPISGPFSAAPLPQYSGDALSGPAFSGPALSGPALGGPALGGPALGGPALSGPALSGPGYPVAGPTYNDGGLLLGGNLASSPGAAVTSTSVGPSRVIGSSVSVGRPIAGATRYELQSVIQDVIRRVPVEVTRHVQVAVPVPQPYPVRQEVRVPVPQPYPVQVDVVKHVPYPVYKTQHIPVERPVPYEVIRKVPFEVIRKVHIPVEQPYEVIKKVHVPIEKAVEVPVAVWKPYPIHIIKHVTHYKKGW